MELSTIMKKIFEQIELKEKRYANFSKKKMPDKTWCVISLTYGELKTLRKHHGEEAEQLRVQLAGCGVAASGGTGKKVVAKKGQYGWSPSYEAVLKLRKKYDKLIRSDLGRVEKAERRKRAKRLDQR